MSISPRVQPWWRALASPPAAWVVLCCLAGAAHLALYGGPFDDSYISFRYARHVAEGLGYVYNAGERVEGFTCFGWVTLLAGVAAVGLPLTAIASILAAAAGLVMVVLTARLSRLSAPHGRFWPVAPALVALHGTWAYFAMTGMETTMFCALLTAALILSLGPGLPRWALAGLLFGAATLMRPEGVGYFALTAAVLATDPPARRHWWRFVAMYLAVMLPFLAWRWSYFGDPLPNTYYAKASGGSGLLAAGLRYLEQFMTLHAFWLAPVALVLQVRRQGLTLAAKLFAAWLLGAAVDVVLVGGDAFAYFRFFLPVIPIGAVLLASLLDDLARWQRARWPAVAATAALLSITLAAEFVPQLTITGRNPRSNFSQVYHLRHFPHDLTAIGLWLRSSVPPDTRLAINPAGIVPYLSGLPTIDMLGLTDAHIARRPLRVGSGARGHEKHDAAYVLSREPDLIIPGLPALSSRPLQGPDLYAWFGRWFEFLPGDRELFANPRLARDYRGLTVTIEPGRYLTLFVSRKSYDRLFGAAALAAHRPRE
jgi:arabinofuranosyltransferase